METQIGCIYLETDAVAIDSGELCYPHWTLEKITELKRQGHGDVPRKSNMETCSEGRRAEDGGVSSRGQGVAGTISSSQSLIKLQGTQTWTL